MINRDTRARSITRRLLSILEEPIPCDPMDQHSQYCELLELESAAQTACVEQWLLDELQIAREAAGEAVLVAASEARRH
ncbi:hypothetical protein MOX02_45300 [Methylobacterium oxalidis]|uniref:Uncharacterized protein n=1 Tax=Methylobacterium oxalidis TaxID=944322 RepID=A0A512J968_9HYPH|nr:hypothetical protein MOX02_45300 [Methylobacterium oxalidis]GLS63930.1 hypothetical protein GCM10007888_23110 [Methylobacterium oxalidis]